MTKQTVQKKTINNNLETTQKDISIQFSLDGFSFCISDTSTKSPVCFTNYTFKEAVPSPQVLLEKIKEIFRTDTDLQHDFTTITVLHQNNLATIVPDVLFDENNLEDYLSFTVKTLADDFIAFDNIPTIQAKNVYVPYVNINNYFFQNFGEFEYQHHTTALITTLVAQTKNSTEKHFFVHVSETQLDIVITQGPALLFYNSFSFDTKEDFIYYILFTAEQLAMDPDIFLLCFSGAIEEDSELYKITYQYVRNISFTPTKNTLFKDSAHFSAHSHYTLLA